MTLTSDTNRPQITVPVDVSGDDHGDWTVSVTSLASHPFDDQSDVAALTVLDPGSFSYIFVTYVLVCFYN